jgi:hypothetical protein
MLSKRLLISAAGLTGVAVVLVVLSPLMVDWLGRHLRVDAQLVNQIGESYGAISALLSGIGLCLVGISTFLQMRQTEIGRLHAVRALQLDLLRMSLDEPEYRVALGVNLSSLNETAWRRHAYVNLWMMYLQMNYLACGMQEQGLRKILEGELFAGDAGKGYWQRARAVFIAEAISRRHRDFVRIVDDVYFKSVQQVADALPLAEMRATEPPVSNRNISSDLEGDTSILSREEVQDA